MATEEQKYPIGKYQKPDVFTDEIIRQFINEIEIFPEKIKQAVTGLTEDQLDTPYRPEGWTIRQVVNHCADSHMNSFVRFKLALTEDHPTIKPYYEDRWAELPDARLYRVADCGHVPERECPVELVEALLKALAGTGER